MVVGSEPWSVGWMAGKAFLWLCSRAIDVGVSPASTPILWITAAFNVVTQWACLTGVYSLISQADQITVNVVLTVRKFVSLMTSIYLFNNTFTGYHWLGALFVFAGASLYGMATQINARLEKRAAVLSPVDVAKKAL
jgi:drug/metabolite transporter (DMT)-like permease